MADAPWRSPNTHVGTRLSESAGRHAVHTGGNSTSDELSPLGSETDGIRGFGIASIPFEIATRCDTVAADAARIVVDRVDDRRGKAGVGVVL
jgi:hypothetical protein